MRRGPGSLYRKLLTLRFLATRDRAAALRFLRRHPEYVLRLRLLRRFVAITNAVRGYHTLSEMLTISDAVLERGHRRPPLVVECGAGLGASTAKLSVATAAVGGRMVVFDSFRGIPANREVHRSLDGRTMVYRRGAFRGRERAVRRVIEAWGEPVVELRRGWFEKTMRDLDLDRIDVAVLDVDLVASTRLCVASLYPRLARGGVLFTQDGHLEATVKLLGDPEFWRREVHAEPPSIAGLGSDKLLAIPADGVKREE